MSVSRCWHCDGKSQIEATQKADNRGIIQRTRGCIDCGQTWTTMEIESKRFRLLLKIENFLKRIKV